MPLGTGLAAAIAAWLGVWSPGRPDGGVALAVGIVGVCAALATLGALIGMCRTHLAKMMRRTGHHRDLTVALAGGLALFLACAYIGLTELLGLYAHRLPAPAEAGLLAAGTLSLVDVVRKFFLVVRASLHSD